MTFKPLSKDQINTLSRDQIKTVSIGIMRDDGEFTLLATLNNNDEHMAGAEFAYLAETVRGYLELVTEQEVIMLEREDAPAYVELY